MGVIGRIDKTSEPSRSWISPKSPLARVSSADAPKPRPRDDAPRPSAVLDDHGISHADDTPVARISVAYDSLEDLTREYVSNISKGGILLESRENVAAQDLVTVVLELGWEDESISLLGRVVYASEPSDCPGGATRKVGIEFDDRADNGFTAIEARVADMLLPVLSARQHVPHDVRPDYHGPADDGTCADPAETNTAPAEQLRAAQDQLAHLERHLDTVTQEKCTLSNKLKDLKKSTTLLKKQLLASAEELVEAEKENEALRAKLTELEHADARAQALAGENRNLAERVALAEGQKRQAEKDLERARDDVKLVRQLLEESQEYMESLETVDVEALEGEREDALARADALQEEVNRMSQTMAEMSHLAAERDSWRDQAHVFQTELAALKKAHARREAELREQFETLLVKHTSTQEALEALRQEATYLQAEDDSRDESEYDQLSDDLTEARKEIRRLRAENRELSTDLRAALNDA